MSVQPPSTPAPAASPSKSPAAAAESGLNKWLTKLVVAHPKTFLCILAAIALAAAAFYFL